MSAILPSRPILPHSPTACPACMIKLEYPTPSATTSFSSLQVRCYKCSTVFAPTPPQPKSPPPTSTSIPKRSRKIGTQEKPLETGYYDVLCIPVDATPDDIKKAYRRLAIKLHPDKNRDDPLADERFKELAVAYQTLSDPALRKKYNEFGPKESQPEGGFVDPEEVFSAMFGGEKFVPIIGHLSLAKDMKTALQGDEDETTAPDGQKQILSADEKARKDEKNQRILTEKAKEREERVKKLVETLENKLSIFAESARDVQDAEIVQGWRRMCELEAEDLKVESFGAELLHTIGFVYTSKARHYLAASQTWMGVGGWLHGVQSKYHVFSETVSTVKAALEVKQVFEQLAGAEKAGATPEQRRKLEEQATEKGIQALFKGTKLEIDSILRETCDRVLYPEKPLEGNKGVLRATALEILGEAYQSVPLDGKTALDAGYIKVDVHR